MTIVNYSPSIHPYPSIALMRNVESKERGVSRALYGFLNQANDSPYTQLGILKIQISELLISVDPNLRTSAKEMITQNTLIHLLSRVNELRPFMPMVKITDGIRVVVDIFLFKSLSTMLHSLNEFHKTNIIPESRLDTYQIKIFVSGQLVSVQSCLEKIDLSLIDHSSDV